MTIAHWCILIACALPIVCAGIAKGGKFSVPRDQGRYDNRNPRHWLAAQTGYRARASAAMANSFEALPLFIAGVLVAHQLGGPQPVVDLLAASFIGLRVVYIALYVANRDSLRSLVWFLAVAACVALFFSNKF
jgi:uncharacterized MAPEG superfamily protein